MKKTIKIIIYTFIIIKLFGVSYNNIFAKYGFDSNTEERGTLGECNTSDIYRELEKRGVDTTENKEKLRKYCIESEIALYKYYYTGNEKDKIEFINARCKKIEISKGIDNCRNDTTVNGSVNKPSDHSIRDIVKENGTLRVYCGNGVGTTIKIVPINYNTPPTPTFTPRSSKRYVCGKNGKINITCNGIDKEGDNLTYSGDFSNSKRTIRVGSWNIYL